MKINIGAAIKLVRKRNRLSQTELAKMIGINSETLSCYESGKTTPSMQTLIKIASATNSTVDEILSLNNCRYIKSPILISNNPKIQKRLSNFYRKNTRRKHSFITVKI